LPSLHRGGRGGGGQHTHTPPNTHCSNKERGTKVSKLYLLVVMLLSQNLFDSGVLSAARLGAASAASREGALMGAEGEARGLSWGEPFTGFRTLTSVAREGSEATLLSSSNKKTIRYYSVRPESGLDTLVRRTPSLY
jgi:hypothetical protein